MAAKNLILNGLVQKCQFYTAFVSDKMNEEIEFFTVGIGAAGSMFKGHAETAVVLGQSYKVPTVTIDALVDYFGWMPDFIKIDVEGAESLVLGGAIKTVSTQQLRIMVEMHSPPELPMIENARKVLAWCKQVNYQAWYMKEASLLKTPEQIAERGKCHLLLQPISWEYPPFLNNIKQGQSLSTVIE